LQEKEIEVGMARLHAVVEAFVNRKKELEEIIEALQEEKRMLMRKKEMYTWLEDYFLPLTFTIEKHIMTQIHRLFSEVFAEWFSILIDDEEVYATIDDGFSPVITQNGYEVAFANLSGGERTSVALAYRLALNRVIHDVIADIKTKELLILDEPTDGFSSEQLDKVRDVLERMPLKQTIIVSHEAKIETFVENVIRIGKNGHVSCVG
jgi:exonuclease SbcC